MSLSRRTLFATSIAAGAVGLAACASNDPMAASGSSAGGSSIVVGSADFSESIVLAEIYAGALRAKGLTASTKTNIGSREIYLKALGDGSVDVVPEYTGALAFYYDKTFAETDPAETYARLQKLLPADFTVLDKSAAEDSDSTTVTKDTAAKYNLKTIVDLAPVAGSLVIGAPPEFDSRPQGLDGLKRVYGLTFKEFTPLKGQALISALKNGQVQVADIFSTSPSIPAEGFVILEDTKKLFGWQNIVPLARKEKADAMKAALNAVSSVLTTPKVIEMLKRTDIDKADPKTVAGEFLKSNNLG